MNKELEKAASAASDATGLEVVVYPEEADETGVRCYARIKGKMQGPVCSYIFTYEHSALAYLTGLYDGAHAAQKLDD